MPLPFLMYCDSPAATLFQLSDGRFQLAAKGAVAPFMAGYQYLLVEQPLAKYLESLQVAGVRYEPAILFDRKTNSEQRSHVRICVTQRFRHDQINELALDGFRLLTMDDQHYFVSPELKRCLENSSFNYLRFSEGLTDFAAGSLG